MLGPDLCSIVANAVLLLSLCSGRGQRYATLWRTRTLLKLGRARTVLCLSPSSSMIEHEKYIGCVDLRLAASDCCASNPWLHTRPNHRCQALSIAEGAVSLPAREIQYSVARSQGQHGEEKPDPIEKGARQYVYRRYQMSVLYNGSCIHRRNVQTRWSLNSRLVL